MKAANVRKQVCMYTTHSQRMSQCEVNREFVECRKGLKCIGKISMEFGTSIEINSQNSREIRRKKK